MADSVSQAGANSMLTTLIALIPDIQLHTGDPGAAGTSNVASVTTREGVTWNTPAAGAVTASNQPVWSSWAGTNGQVITDISFWSAPTGGTFYMSIPLSTSVTMDTGNSLTLTSISVNITTAS
jgi:hypothetical protein